MWDTGLSVQPVVRCVFGVKRWSPAAGPPVPAMQHSRKPCLHYMTQVSQNALQVGDCQVGDSK